MSNQPSGTPPVTPYAHTNSAILIVDDEVEIRAILRQGLQSAGYQTLEASCESELFSQLDRPNICLVTLDLGLGETDALELAREIRRRKNIPIIMITGRDQAIDRITGLEYGADDYISKPFHIREVVLRVASVLKRYDPAHQVQIVDALSPIKYGSKLAFDHCILDPGKRELRRSTGELVPLTETEFYLLHIFLTRAGRVISRDELWADLRGLNWSPYDRTIDGHVARLRRKIEDTSGESGLIKSVRGVGYVFTGEVLHT